MASPRPPVAIPQLPRVDTPAPFKAALAETIPVTVKPKLELRASGFSSAEVSDQAPRRGTLSGTGGFDAAAKAAPVRARVAASAPVDFREAGRLRWLSPPTAQI